MNRRRLEVVREKAAVRTQQIASGRREPPSDWWDTPVEAKKVSTVKAERRLSEMMRKVGFRYAR